MLIIIHLLSIMVNDAIFHKLMVLFTSGAFLLCLGIPLIGCYLYLHHPEYFASYNGTMLSRIQLSCSFYSKNSGFGFYGLPIYDNDCLDMFFPYVSLHWGTAATIILTFAIIYAIIMAAIKHNTSMLLLLFFFLIYGCSETAHIYPVYSYFSLLLGYYIMNRKPFSLHIK